MNSSKDLVEWRYCKGPCGELKPVTQFPKMKGRKTKKRPERLTYYLWTCYKCQYKKRFNNNPRRRRPKTEEPDYSQKLRILMDSLNPALHPYL